MMALSGLLSLECFSAGFLLAHEISRLTFDVPHYEVQVATISIGESRGTILLGTSEARSTFFLFWLRYLVDNSSVGDL